MYTIEPILNPFEKMAKELNNNNTLAIGNNDDIKAISKNDNTVIHSKVKGFEHSYAKVPTTSIKYVVSGEEAYRIDGHTYRVKADEFLIVNHGRNYEGEIDKNIETEGVCIYLHNDMIGGITKVLGSSDATLLDNPFDEPVQNCEFFENIYKANTSALGLMVRKLYRNIRHRSLDTVRSDRDLYHALTEILLLDQQKVSQEINRLKSVKRSTKQELYRRVLLAKEYLDEFYYKKLDVNEVSQVAALSEYHFFRTFKQVFGISPHKYLIKKRLQKSANLLRQNRYSITEVAYLIGFPDIHSFSKSFKKEFGLTPSKYIK